MKTVFFLHLVVFWTVFLESSSKPARSPLDLGIFRSNPCDSNAIHQICENIPTYNFGQFEVFTRSRSSDRLRDRLKTVVKECNQPNTFKLKSSEYIRKILDRYEVIKDRAEKEHSTKAHALHLYMRTAAFLKINLGIDYLYRISIEEIEDLVSKRQRVVLRAVAEPGCTRPDILQKMGLNQFEIASVLKHDQYMTEALKKVTGLESVVYRQFAPFFEEFGQHLSFAHGHKFDDKFTQILAEHTPADQMMMDLRENYAHWHVECTVREKAEEVFQELKNGTVGLSSCNDVLPDVLDRLNALEMFDTSNKRQKVIKRLEETFNFVKKAIREKFFRIPLVKQMELKLLSLLHSFHIQLLHVSDFDNHKTFVQQISEIDKDLDDHISYKMSTLNLSLTVYDLLNSIHAGNSNTILIQISEIKHWNWAENLDDPTFFGSIGTLIARKVWKKINETVTIKWGDIVNLEDNEELTDYQFQQIALTTALRALQLKSYQTPIHVDSKGQKFTSDQAFNIAYFIENECDSNSSHPLSDVYSNSFNCITDDYFSFANGKTNLRLESPFTLLHLRQPQVDKSKENHLGLFSERNLNNSINPCDDFYQFSCGKSTESIYQETYNRNIKLIEKELQRKVSENEPKAIQFLKRIYQKCVRGELKDLPYTKEELLPVIEKIKGLLGVKNIPVKAGEISGSQFLDKFGALSGYVHSEFNVGPYKYYTAKRTGVHKHVEARILTLPPSDSSPNDRGNAWARFFDLTGHGINATEIDQLVYDGINLRNASFLADINGNGSKNLREKSVSSTAGELDCAEVGFNLTSFFSTSIGFLLPSEDKVSVSLTVNYSKLEDPSLQAAAINGVIEETLLHLFSNDIPDNVVCYGVMETAGEFLLGRILLDSRFVFGKITQEDRKSGKILFSEFQEKLTKQSEHVFNSMKFMLKEAPWLSEETLQRALQRVDNLTMILGNDPLLLDEALTKIYDKTLFDESHVIKKQYAHNVMPIRRAEFGCCTLSLLPYSPVMSFLIHLLETTKTIIFPANALFWPMYDHNHPSEYVFGFFGASVAHEVGHMFDGRSLLPSEFPDDPAWMSDSEARSYAAMAACVAEQYDHLCDGEGECADGVQSNIEIMADNIGLQLAYRALQSWLEIYGPDPRPPGRLIARLTTPQLFFLNYVQYMCEPKGRARQTEKAFRAHPRVDFRIQGALMNMPAFSDAFNCPVGSRYWRNEESGGTCPIFNGALKKIQNSRLEEIWAKEGVLKERL
ncbi:unnamed protein product [Bursaphelenchus xylophilus]|uniref:(pine wood nematode) hypothetical protein n=1 Tax=Bursaphelenchus xylophilus TaxID=6326 RepID=A0A1I7SWU2_BURXY|nr:unnamed protein product [Bursaphelenchus xylophilus]CAG9099922.1 unnamed protein product [Bursaphelenchus xylophilus]